MALKCFGRNAVTGEAVIVEGTEAITAVEPLIGGPPDLPFLAPGFIDLQVNGFAGVDYCSGEASVEEIDRSLQVQFATGMTRCLPTIITGGPVEAVRALSVLAEAKETLPDGSCMEGFHVEGPYISPEDGPRGAHPLRWCRPPDIEEYKRYREAARGYIKLITVSPEWPGTNEFIEHVVRDGVVVAIGHTKATAEQIQDAVAAGATMSTHLGNGAHAVMARHPNYIWEQMAEDRLTASFIVDGIHIGAAFLKTALRAKGIERSVLITDAVMPALCEPGDYRLGEVDVTLHPPGDRVTVRGTMRLAGAVLTMNAGVGNLMRLAGISLRDAITMATTNAARAGRISGRRRGLVAGERADLVEFTVDAESRRVRVQRTWLSGRLVYESPETSGVDL